MLCCMSNYGFISKERSLPLSGNCHLADCSIPINFHQWHLYLLSLMPFSLAHKEEIRLGMGFKMSLTIFFVGVGWPIDNERNEK